MERKTKQKEIIIKYLEENSNKHLLISQIQSDLKNEIGLATIYRLIDNLIKEGSVTKIPCENKQGYCYKYNVKNNDCSDHYHLICEKCNKLYHYESKDVKKLEKKIKQDEQFEIDNSKVVFYGICKECQ